MRVYLQILLLSCKPFIKNKLSCFSSPQPPLHVFAPYFDKISDIVGILNSDFSEFIHRLSVNFFFLFKYKQLVGFKNALQLK